LILYILSPKNSTLSLSSGSGFHNLHNLFLVSDLYNFHNLILSAYPVPNMAKPCYQEEKFSCLLLWRLRPDLSELQSYKTYESLTPMV
jgi:hypothetical protein